MIGFLRDIYAYSNNFFYLYAFVFVLCSGCGKRRVFALRVIGGLVIGSAAAYGYTMMSFLFRNTALLYISKYALCFALVYASALFCWSADPKMLVYFCICGYSFQHLCYNVTLMIQALTGLAGNAVDMNSWQYILLEFLVTAAGFVFASFVYRRLTMHAPEVLKERLILPFAILVVFAVVFSVLGFGMSEPGTRLLLSGYAALLCLVMLYAMYKVAQIAHATYEKHTSQAIAAKQKEQYESYKKNIDYINIKCHDLKKQIELLRGSRVSDEKIAEMSETINIYDSAADTGNETLDVILTEKGMQCKREGIELTYMADGSLLSHMDAVDICAVFCNILDNAIESTSGEADARFRTISLTVAGLGNLVHITAINGCSRPPVRGEDGYETTKKDKSAHGFGLKSIAAAVRNYDGEMKIYTDSGSFRMDILIPMP